MSRKQPAALARAAAERRRTTPEQLALRNTLALERIADALERMLATHARVMFFPRPATEAEYRMERAAATSVPPCGHESADGFKCLRPRGHADQHACSSKEWT